VKTLQRCAFAALGFLLLAASPNPDAPYLRAQRLVDIGGRRINLYCTGSGSPTVVLDTDGDDTTAAWHLVQPAVSKTTRVCSYDPPGFGFSDPLGGSAADADANAQSLHRLLQRAGISGPIVLVGYSVSGLYDRVYADRYRSDVAGMVLVSPAVSYQNEKFAHVAPALAADMSMDALLRTCVTAAHHRAIRPGSPAYQQCEYSPPDQTLSPQLLDEIHRQWQGYPLWSSFAAADSDETERRSSAEVEREQRRYGTMPLIVLTTTKDAQALPIPAPQKKALVQSWIAWHRGISQLSSVGVDFIVAGSSSSIPLDRPHAVISAIDEVVSEIRR
jgi:pimeloyl-ACP methyl ester carboxylesterase